ncbi:PAS domain S-box protein [Roseomonas sp. OT10]|uniref:PAS domain-containing sensor histidine kinase n=1 Tax=Roseomonas cutis TaxID=2897332 RepID=UPI001E380499|nr:PAS domain S-box protein [Roseomonas sp. OT10]UFN48477.1 PAS domain S-box protein [Roseomonas sp. OT10]
MNVVQGWLQPGGEVAMAAARERRRLPRPQRPTGPVAAVLLTVAIFAADTLMPLGSAVAGLYSVVLMLCATMVHRRGVIAVGLGCAGLMVVSYLASQGCALVGGPLLRLCFSLMALAGVMVLTLRMQETYRAVRAQARLLDLTHDAIFVRDMDDTILFWSRGAEALYGWSAAEALGRQAGGLLQPAVEGGMEAALAEALHVGHWEGEVAHTTRGGRQVIVASRWAVRRDHAGRPLTVMETNNDITERHEALRALRHSEHRFRTIVQGAGVAIWEEDYSALLPMLAQWRAAGIGDVAAHLATHPEALREAVSRVRVTDVNETAVRMFQARDRGELLASLWQVFLPETLDSFARILASLAEGHPSCEAETTVRTLRGERRTILMSVTLPAALQEDGRVLVSIMDITERRRTEEALRQAREDLAHAGRVATLGELTAAITHEVSQPVAAIAANGAACVRWLSRPDPDLGEARQAAQRVVRDARRAGEVVARIRGFLGKGDAAWTRLDLRDLATEALHLVEGEIRRHGVLLQVEIEPGLPAVLGDRLQIEHVLVNLLVNGIQSLAAVEDRPRRLLLRAGRHGADILVQVEDNGLGVAAEQSTERLFDPFYTTRTAGMGMGLTVCRGTVEAHGGRIRLLRRAGPGAEVRFTLPAAEAAA